MNEDTDAPVTDIIFVKDMDECPEGYKMINHCPCGHDAQLWENVIGDKDQERYIAYTKDSTSEDVVEDLLITDGGFRYLKPGFVVMRRTLNGDKVLRHRDVAVKKGKRKEAKEAVLDVAVFRSQDKPSKLYRKIIKIRGLYVCVRVAPLLAKYKNVRRRSETLSVQRSPPSEDPTVFTNVREEESVVRSRAQTSPSICYSDPSSVQYSNDSTLGSDMSRLAVSAPPPPGGDHTDSTNQYPPASNPDGSNQYPPPNNPNYTDVPNRYPPPSTVAHTGAPSQYPPTTGAPNQYPLTTGAPNQYPPTTGAPNQYPPTTGAPNQYPPTTGAPNQYPPTTGAPNQYPPPGQSGFYTQPTGYPRYPPPQQHVSHFPLPPSSQYTPTANNLGFPQPMATSQPPYPPPQGSQHMSTNQSPYAPQAPHQGYNPNTPSYGFNI